MRLLTLAGSAATALAVSIGSSAAQDFNWRQFEGQTLLGAMPEGPLVRAYIEPQLPAFEALTGIKVRLDTLATAQSRRKLDIVLSGQDPSVDFFIVQMDERGGAYTTAGYQENLEPFLKNPKLTPASYNYPADWAKGCLATISVVRGQPLNNIVFSAQAQLLHIRTDLFQKHGVKVPETVAELEDAAKKLTIKDASGNLETYGFLGRAWSSQATASFATYLYNAGGSWFVEENGVKKSNIASPKSIDAFEYYGRLIKNYAPAAVLNNSPDANANLFASGKAAMLSELNYYIFNFNDASKSRIPGKVATVLVPSGAGGSHPNIPTTSLAISSFSKKKEAAWLFLAWITSREQMLYGQKQGTPMCRESVWRDPSYQPPSASWGEASRIALVNGRALAKPPAVAVEEVREAVTKVIDVAIRDGSRAAIEAEAKKQAAIIDGLVAKAEADGKFTGPSQAGPGVAREEQLQPIRAVSLGQ